MGRFRGVLEKCQILKQNAFDNNVSDYQAAQDLNDMANRLPHTSKKVKRKKIGFRRLKS